MQNSYPLSNLCDFEVMITCPLSSFDQKILLKLYMPIVGDKVISLYQTFASLVPEATFESDIFQHEKIIKLMHLRSIERFCDIRNKLEAIGLIDTYYKDQLYVYCLNKPLSPVEFFSNTELSTLLEYQIGHEAYLTTYYEFVMRKLDINKFEKINHTFDEVFELELSDTIMMDQASYTGKNNGIVISNKNFDYGCFTVLLTAQDLIKEEYFVNQEFIDLIYRYSFLYNLSPEEMKNVILLSCDENKMVNFEEIAKNAKIIYNQKGKKLGVVPKVSMKKTTKTNDKLINFLESASPNDFVKQKTGVALTGSEIEMFDQLLRDTGIGIGVLNVLIGYVLEELEGQIPSYNYFLKIINSWRRSKVVSTLDAIDYINKGGKTKKVNKSKTEKSVPEWYDTYLEEVEKPQENKKEEETSDLEELKEFFQPDKKEQ